MQYIKTDPLESARQEKIIKKYEAAGWYVIKLIQTNKNGIPDLLLHRIDPASGIPVTMYIEAKRYQDQDARKLQKYRHKELKKHGIETLILSAA